MTLAPHPFSVCVIDTGEELYFVIEGELDVATAPPLLDCFQAANRSEAPKDICLDVAGLDFVGSAALSLLVTMERRARASGAKFTIRFPKTQFLNLLEMTGLAEFFELRDTESQLDGHHPQWVSRRF